MFGALGFLGLGFRVIETDAWGFGLVGLGFRVIETDVWGFGLWGLKPTKGAPFKLGSAWHDIFGARSHVICLLRKRAFGL